MGAQLNFASPSLSSLPNGKTSHPAVSPPAPALVPSVKHDLVGLSQVGRTVITKSALKWLKKRPREAHSLSHLLAKPSHDWGSSRNEHTLVKAAQKLAKPSGWGLRIGEKHCGQLPGKQMHVYDNDCQFLRGEGLEKDPMKFRRELPSCEGAHGKGKGKGYGAIAATEGNNGGDGQSIDSGAQPERVPQSGRWAFAAGGVSLSSAAMAAQASVGFGGGNGGQPPSSGGGGGGGGGFEAGSNGESFFGDLIYGPGRNQDVEEASSSPRRAAVTRRRVAENRLPARTLASLSSAAGDLMDGEGPIGGRGGGGRMSSREVEEVHHIPNQQASYAAAKSPFSDGMRELPRESMQRNYNPSADPFFAGAEDGGRAQDRSSHSPPSSSFEGSGNNSNNVQDISRGRDFSPMMVERSTGYNSSSIHYPSGKQHQPQQYHKSYAQGNELNKAPLRGPESSYYSNATTSSRGDSLHVAPSEFSSIRAKISEIPGYAQEGGDEGKMSSDRHRQAPDISRWLGGIAGLFNSILGKATGGGRGGGGGGSGTGDQSGNNAGKKELVNEVANRTLQMIKDQTTENGLAKSSETGALRRLQRETFSDMLKIRERLDKLEHHTGARRGKSSPGDAFGGVKTTLKGEVNAGGAYVLVDDLTTNLSRFSLQHAGLLTGLDVRFIFETPMRENDLLTTQCGVGQASGELDSSILGGPISLQKINYVAHINDTLSLAIAPLGAKADDMAETINHLQGQALTSFAGRGPTMYQHCRGSALGASLRSNSVMLSMSQFLSGWGNRALDTITSGPLCLSTLAQIMVQPCEHMVFSMSAVNNLWPCPPLPSSSGFHWSEMGPLVLCKTITRRTQPTGTFTANDLLPSSSTASFLSQVHVPERDRWCPDLESTFGSSGTSMQSVAFSGEVDLGGHVSIGGWAQVDRAEWLEELERKDFQWNVSLAKSSGPNVHWGLSMGRRKRDEWGEDGSVSPTSGPMDPSSSQLQGEAFVKLKVGRGFCLQPGLVYIVDSDTQTPAFMLRSSWSL